MRYYPFCADFGPFNLGMTHLFMQEMLRLLEEPNLRNVRLVYYTRMSANDVTNAIFLLGSFLVAYLGASIEEAWMPFCTQQGIVRPYRDATWLQSSYDLHVKIPESQLCFAIIEIGHAYVCLVRNAWVYRSKTVGAALPRLFLFHFIIIIFILYQVKDCWRGLAKAIATGLYDPDTFDAQEYFYYDHPQHGDMHQVVPGKFIAFKGPVDQRGQGQRNYALLPVDFVDVFRSKNVAAVVRLNNPEYDRADFIRHGICHYGK